MTSNLFCEFVGVVSIEFGFAEIVSVALFSFPVFQRFCGKDHALCQV